ncbi:MAG: LapA family protein [Acidimicrobiales bacterium]
MTLVSEHEELKAPSTRTSAVWTSAAAGAVAALLMLVFILQNSQRTELNFLWLHGDLPVGAALLLAAVIGALVVLLLGAARLLQLRLMARRHRRTVDSGTGAP